MKSQIIGASERDLIETAKSKLLHKTFPMLLPNFRLPKVRHAFSMQWRYWRWLSFQKRLSNLQPIYLRRSSIQHSFTNANGWISSAIGTHESIISLHGESRTNRERCPGNTHIQGASKKGNRTLEWSNAFII